MAAVLAPQEVDCVARRLQPHKHGSGQAVRLGGPVRDGTLPGRQGRRSHDGRQLQRIAHCDHVPGRRQTFVWDCRGGTAWLQNCSPCIMHEFTQQANARPSPRLRSDRRRQGQRLDQLTALVQHRLVNIRGMENRLVDGCYPVLRSSHSKQCANSLYAALTI